MKSDFMKGSSNIFDLYRSLHYKSQFRKSHPDYFDPDGLLVFSGPQGSGKTISAVQYCKRVLSQYPQCIFVTNVDISGLPSSTSVVEYNGLDTLFSVSNGYNGVLYLIDEIHLEFNSLESKNISIEEMTEFAQQRKQRKHIVGTSQVFMRLAKPLREQVKRVVLCKNYFGLLQHNTEIDGTTAVEEGGHLIAAVTGSYWWFHTPSLYGSYDTYAKMHRYKDEWNGRKATPASLPYSQSPLRSVSPNPSSPSRPGSRQQSGRKYKHFTID